MVFVCTRGADKTEIYSIALSQNLQWLVVSGNKGTMRIFSLRARPRQKDTSIGQSAIVGGRGRVVYQWFPAWAKPRIASAVEELAVSASVSVRGVYNIDTVRFVKGD